MTSKTMFGALLVGVIALLSAPGAHAQLDANLVYTPVPPCRIVDTQLAGGALTANSARSIDVTAVVDYGFQGGDASNCAGVGAAGSFAAVALNVTVINPSVSGTLKAYAFLATTPATATAMSFAAGEVRSNFVIVKIDQGASANELTLLSTANAHVTVDVVGYFIVPPTTPVMECVTTAQTSLTIGASGGTGNAISPSCAAGFLSTGTNCESSVWQMPIVYQSKGTCSAQNNSASSATLRASQTCCRVLLQ